MKGKGLYSIFAVAALAAVAGFVYFGSTANQQASVANINLSKTTTTVNSGKPIIPTDEPTNPTLPVTTEAQWRFLCRDGKAHIQVLSPNGSEVYQAGQQVNVKWRSCNLQGNIAEINLMSTNGWSGGTGITFDKDLANDGSENVTLPTSQQFTLANEIYGKRFKIEIVAGSTTTGIINDFSNDTFTINQDAKLEVSTATTNPVAHTVLLSSTTNTNDVVLLKFKIKAVGSTLSINKIPVQITTTGHNVSSIVSSLKITKPNGTILASADPSTGKKIVSGVITSTNGCTLSCGYVFTLSNPIPQVVDGGSYEFNVVANIKPAAIAIGGGSIVGDKIKADIAKGDILLPANLVATVIQTGDNVPAGSASRTGSSLGNTMTLGFAEIIDVCPNIAGVQATIPTGMNYNIVGDCVSNSNTTATAPTITVLPLVSTASIISNPTNNDDTGVFNMRFRITANNSDVFIPKSVTSPFTIYKVEKSGGVAVTSGTVGTISSLTNTYSGPVIPSYRISYGTSEDFMITVNLKLPTAGSAGVYRAILDRFAWSVKDDGVYEYTHQFSPTIKTDYISLN